MIVFTRETRRGKRQQPGAGSAARRAPARRAGSGAQGASAAAPGANSGPRHARDSSADIMGPGLTSTGRDTGCCAHAHAAPQTKTTASAALTAHRLSAGLAGFAAAG